MGRKIDPCTGIINPGPCRPRKRPSPAKRPLPTIREDLVGLSMPQLLALAREIGMVIAEQLKPLYVAPSVVVDRGQFLSVQSTKVVEPFAFNIDESIIDVGIGDQDALEKGEGSVKIAKRSVEMDNIERSKKALRALKAGR